jgi:hypothetical protein
LTSTASACDQVIDVVPECLGLAVAEEVLGGRIPDGDSVVEVGRHDGSGTKFEQRFPVLLLAAQLRLALLKSLVGKPALGDVLDHRQSQPRSCSLLVSQRRLDDLRPNHAPVLPEVAHRELIAISSSGDQLAVQLQHLWEIVGMRVLGEVHRGELLLGVAEHLHVRAVSGVERRPGCAADRARSRLLERTPGDTDGRLLEHGAKALLTLAERFLCFLALRNVHEEALDVQRLPLVVLDHDGVIPQPDRPSISSE